MRNQKFEAFFAKRHELSPARVAAMFDGRNYRDYDYHVELAWAAWCTALGFEVPEDAPAETEVQS